MKNHREFPINRPMREIFTHTRDFHALMKKMFTVGGRSHNQRGSSMEDRREELNLARGLMDYWIVGLMTRAQWLYPLIQVSIYPAIQYALAHQ